MIKCSECWASAGLPEEDRVRVWAFPTQGPASLVQSQDSEKLEFITNFKCRKAPRKICSLNVPRNGRGPGSFLPCGPTGSPEEAHPSSPAVLTRCGHPQFQTLHENPGQARVWERRCGLGSCLHQRGSGVQGFQTILLPHTHPSFQDLKRLN